MKKRNILVSLSVAALLSVGAVSVSEVNSANTNVVQAAVRVQRKKLTHNAYVYRANGKRFNKKKLKKGLKVKIFGTKTIKGKKYYKIGKDKYVKVANFKRTNVKSSVVSITNYGTSTSKKTSSNSGFRENKDYYITTDKNGNKVVVGRTGSSKGGNTSSSTGSTSSASTSNKGASTTTSTTTNGKRYNTRKSSWDNSASFTAADEAWARKYMNKSVYFTDDEVQQIEDRLWQDIQNYRVSKGYPAFKKNAELTQLAQQSQVPGTADFNRFSDKLSQNIGEIKTYLPGLASKGLEQAIGLVDSTAYGFNHKGFVMGGDFTHKGWTPTQVADNLFKTYKEADGFQSQLIYGSHQQYAFGALSVHYYASHLGYSGNSVGISFFTVGGYNQEWINYWKNN
ncbi:MULTISPECIES: SLAP domain-containing protein [Lactobacillus]|uniref:S-layer protein C-terminal domain-containing protein n=1 Tax=Lactobacillus xujianguonis TaxID=2495899 RepID=A0A437SWC4_9LACO|nr:MULTISPECIES: SLAP domain-containing protein [Lactobacillus]RVU71213.1 hypothetical protein EJK17_03175 [Lactobacillus xujianguonis]